MAYHMSHTVVSTITVTQLVSAIFKLFIQAHPDLHNEWDNISQQVGSKLPYSALSIALLQLGELDVVLRSMEDDRSANQQENLEFERFLSSGELDAMLTGPEIDRLALSSLRAIDLLHARQYQIFLSETWVCGFYDIFTLLKMRNLFQRNGKFADLSHQLKLLRIPLEKYEIARAKNPSASYKMKRVASHNIASTEIHRYSTASEQRWYSMPFSFSPRGSIKWTVFDGKSRKER